jgi:hypothetical protein
MKDAREQARARPVKINPTPGSEFVDGDPLGSFEAETEVRRAHELDPLANVPKVNQELELPLLEGKAKTYPASRTMASS